MKTKQESLPETAQTVRLKEENGQLKTALASELKKNEKLQTSLEKALQEKEKERQEKEKYHLQLLYYLRLHHGHSSERYVKEDPSQLKLDFAGMEVLPEEKAELEQLAQTITYTRKAGKEKKEHPFRQALPENLERVEEIIEPDPVPEGSVLIGQEVTEILERKPEVFYVRRIIRRKYALKNEEGVVIGQMPLLPIYKSYAGASILAHLLVSKYQDHLPFYRQLEIFKRNGIKIAASTVNGWFNASADLLIPLYDLLKKEVMASDYIQIDETTIPVMDADRPGATRKGYHWIIKSPEARKLYFHYDHGSRAQRVAIDILKDFKGAIQSDGYVAYGIYENKKDVILLGCWAHARRKFEDALSNDAPRASYAMEQIQLFYRIERQIEDEKLSKEEAEQLRQTKAYPLLKAFERWLEANYTQVLPQSKIGKAIGYTYSIYRRLVRYVIDGRYRIDNNGVENGVRPLALGRKNYLFCGNHEAAERTAVIYSLLGTCKLNSVNPERWLTDVLNKLPYCEKEKNYHELLPLQWKEKLGEV